jgi:hypothetical protein
MTDWEEPAWVTEQNKRIEAARPAFEALPSWLTVNFGSVLGKRHPTSVLTKLDNALRALREWRRANNQQQRPDDEVALAIRIVCDAMATEITQSAGAREDPATIAWVTAGLRCPRQPFCTGCDSCFTIDAPHRHDADLTRSA